MKKLEVIGKAVAFAFSHPKRALVELYQENLKLHEKEIREQDENRMAGYFQAGFPETELSELIGGGDWPSAYPVSYLSDGSTVPDYILLSGLARRRKNCEYLEIGTWRGESILNVARFAGHCTSVSWDESMFREAGMDEMIKTINYYYNKMPHENITLIGADSRTFDFTSLNKKYDLIFIDGNHSYEGILNDTRIAQGLLRDEDSFIVWHDYLQLGERIRPETVRGILNGLPEELHSHVFGVRNTLCAVYSPKQLKVKSWEKQPYPAIPKSMFEVSIKETKIN